MDGFGHPRQLREKLEAPFGVFNLVRGVMHKAEEAVLGIFHALKCAPRWHDCYCLIRHLELRTQRGTTRWRENVGSEPAFASSAAACADAVVPVTYSCKLACRGHHCLLLHGKCGQQQVHETGVHAELETAKTIQVLLLGTA
jgi:hypothetical protein